jgi:hypothetical protein
VGEFLKGKRYETGKILQFGFVVGVSGIRINGNSSGRTGSQVWAFGGLLQQVHLARPEYRQQERFSADHIHKRLRVHWLNLGQPRYDEQISYCAG